MRILYDAFTPLHRSRPIHHSFPLWYSDREAVPRRRGRPPVGSVRMRLTSAHSLGGFTQGANSRLSQNLPTGTVFQTVKKRIPIRRHRGASDLIYPGSES